jgi:hypothetical protein
MSLLPGATAPLHWPSASLPPLLTVTVTAATTGNNDNVSSSVAEGRWKWSGGTQ